MTTIKLTGPSWPADRQDPVWPVRGDIVEAEWQAEVGGWTFHHGEFQFFAGSDFTNPFRAEEITE